MKCNHWWRKKSTFFDVTGCKKCLDKSEFRVEMAMNHMTKSAFDLFKQFEQMPKETQELILSKMDFGRISKTLNNPTEKQG